MLMMPNEKPASDAGWNHFRSFALRAVLNAIITHDLQDLGHHLELIPHRRRMTESASVREAAPAPSDLI